MKSNEMKTKSLFVEFPFVLCISWEKTEWKENGGTRKEANSKPSWEIQSE